MGDTGIKLPEIDDALCTGCEACITACSLEALIVVDSKVVLNDPEECDYCGECEAACPTGAITCPYEIVLYAEEGNRE